MSSRKLLAIDLGQTSGKLCLGQYDGEKLTVTKIGSFENADVLAGGHLQWDVLHLYREIVRGIGQAVASVGSVDSLGIDSWGTDHSFVDGSGILLGNPISNRERRIGAYLESFYRVMAKNEIFAHTGVQFSGLSSSSLMQIYCLRCAGSDRLSSARCFLMMPDILNYYLTGERACEISLMSITQLFDQKKGGLSDAIMDRYELPKVLFSAIVDSCNRLGSVKAEIREAQGWNDITVVNPVQHDTASAFSCVLGEEHGAPPAAISLGSWCCIGMRIERPLQENSSFALGFANQRGEDGVTHLRKDVPGLLIAEECRREIESGGKELPWEKIVRMAEEAPENGSVIDFERLSFQGEGDRPIKQINDYLSKTNQHTPENNGELFRCIFTSIAFGIKRTIDQMEGLTGKKTGLLYMLGGGSRNRLLCQWTADLLNVPVRVGMYDAASLGNLVSQLKAGGEIRSFDEGRQILSKSVAQSEIHPRHVERDKLLAHYVRTKER